MSGVAHPMNTLSREALDPPHDAVQAIEEVGGCLPKLPTQSAGRPDDVRRRALADQSAIQVEGLSMFRCVDQNTDAARGPLRKRRR